MQELKNIGVGFLVSFLGSVPLGFLNVVGFEIYSAAGIFSTILYLSGVILIEFWVVFLTLIFADKLNNNEKLLKFIEAFSVAFMFILAFVFYSSAESENRNYTVSNVIWGSAFITGIALSFLNFIQIPFWLSWNLYLLNGKYIATSKTKKYFYLFGTITGTFCGMMALILSLHYFASNIEFLSKYLMRIIIPLVFTGLGIFNGIRFYQKYYRKS